MSEANDNDDPDDHRVPLTLPLDAWHRAKGGRMVEFAGYWMPVQYEGIMAEHLWVRESAGLFDVSHMGQLHLSGEGLDDALEALEHRGGDLEAHGLVDIAHSLTQADAQIVRRLVARHVRHTDSPRGKTILAAWDSYRSKFVKVMPIEYRRALQQLQARTRATERTEVSVAVGD